MKRTIVKFAQDGIWDHYFEEDPGATCALMDAKYPNSAYLGCSNLSEKGHCTIVMQKPKDFNDKSNLMILGHEMMHCFGAAHE